MKQLVFLISLLFIAGCGGPEPRKPKKVKSGSYYKESIERSKQLLAKEERLIQDIIKADTTHSYVNSASGSWYFYNNKSETADYFPQPDDLVTLAYNILSFQNDTIYSMNQIGVQKYKVDKQELFPGLRNSVKLLKEGEVATFLYPSSLGYGYPGDGDKIGVNVPLKSTLVILKIEKESEIVEPIAN